MSRWVSGWVLLGLLTACSSAQDLRKKADALAHGAQMHPVEIPAGAFTLLAYERITDPSAPLHVYIEGDGNPWLTRSQISPDPTPFDPVALTLAVRDPSPNVAYLARPCHYIASPACAPKYWTLAQFSDTTIDAMNQAINRWQGRRIELVGYSGGGAMALLVAARRSDIATLRTVAGNTDTDAFTQFHKISPLSQSLNPASGVQRTASIPQLHFTGKRDKVVPPSLAEAYQKRLPPGHCSAHVTVPGIDHHSGWSDQWAGLLARPLPCTAQ